MAAAATTPSLSCPSVYTDADRLLVKCATWFTSFYESKAMCDMMRRANVPRLAPDTRYDKNGEPTTYPAAVKAFEEHQQWLAGEKERVRVRCQQHGVPFDEAKLDKEAIEVAKTRPNAMLSPEAWSFFHGANHPYHPEEQTDIFSNRTLARIINCTWDEEDAVKAKMAKMDIPKVIMKLKTKREKKTAKELDNGTFVELIKQKMRTASMATVRSRRSRSCI